MRSLIFLNSFKYTADTKNDSTMIQNKRIYHQTVLHFLWKPQRNVRNEFLKETTDKKIGKDAGFTRVAKKSGDLNCKFYSKNLTQDKKDFWNLKYKRVIIRKVTTKNHAMVNNTVVGAFKGITTNKINWSNLAFQTTRDDHFVNWKYLLRGKDLLKFTNSWMM